MPTQRVLILSAHSADASEKESELNTLLASGYRIQQQRDLDNGSVMFVLDSSGSAVETSDEALQGEPAIPAVAQSPTPSPVVDDRPLTTRLRDGLRGKRLAPLGYPLAFIVIVAVTKILWSQTALEDFRDEIQSSFVHRELLVLLASALTGFSLHRRGTLLRDRASEYADEGAEAPVMEPAVPAHGRGWGIAPWLTVMATALFAASLYAHWAERLSYGDYSDKFGYSMIALGLSLLQALTSGYGAFKAFRGRRSRA